MKPYAVVTFTNDANTGLESSSEVPSIWLSPDLKKCWWPNTKNVGSQIIKKAVPEKNCEKKWQQHDVQCIGFYDDISAARNKADGMSSGDEAMREEIKKPKRQTYYAALTSIKEDCEKMMHKTSRVKSVKQKGREEDDYSASDESENFDNKTTIISSPPTLKSTFIKTENEKNKNNIPRVIESIILPMNLNIEKERRNSMHNPETNTDVNNDTAGMQDGNTTQLSWDCSLRDYFTDNGNLGMQFEELKSLINHSSEIMAGKLAEVHIALRKIDDRLETVERVVNQNHSPASSQDTADLAALLPLNTVEQVKEFDAHLLVGDIQPRLILYLSQIGGNSAKECITRILRTVFSANVGKACSWCGQRGNFKICNLTIINVIKDSVRRSYACTDKFFEDDVKEWFRQGGQKFKRQQKKLNTETSVN